MCLESVVINEFGIRVSNNKKIKHQKIGFTVMIRKFHDPYQRYPLFKSCYTCVHTDYREYSINTRNKCKSRNIIALDGETYIAGFHCFHTIVDTLNFLVCGVVKSALLRGEKLVIVKCLLEGFLCTGTQIVHRGHYGTHRFYKEYYAPCTVAKYRTILEEVDLRWKATQK